MPMSSAGRPSGFSDIKVMFVTTGLATGGAEMMLYKLLQHSHLGRNACVVALGKEGDLGPRIRALNVAVLTLNMRPQVPNPIAFLRLFRLMLRYRPNVVSTWMYHADLFGGLAAMLAGIPVVWGLRNSTLDVNKTKLITRAVVRVCAMLSHVVPYRIISCSSKARDIHARLGYRRSLIQVIPNGFDLRRFAPCAESRISVRGELGFTDSTPLVGIVARYDPQKNLEGFIDAASHIHILRGDVRFVMIGAKVSLENERLVERVNRHGLAASLRMLGRRDDIPRLMASLDVLVSASSYGEAFPNVLGEAMACGVPCVATNVGDSAYIIGDCGLVVEAGDMVSLAHSVLEILALPVAERATIGRRGRSRVEALFDIDARAREYDLLFAETAGLHADTESN